MIGIIDFGSGNLKSVFNAFCYLGESAEICEDPAGAERADKIVFPGVGSSKNAMDGLAQRGLTVSLKKQIKNGKPFLGICLGFQLLFERSFEGGMCDCLGLLKGEVKAFPYDTSLKVPQIGWNTVKLVKSDCPLFRGIRDNSFFYFVHSYYCSAEDEQVVSGITDYIIPYASAIWKDNIYAVQFHPERSQENGLKVLKNFIESK